MSEKMVYLKCCVDFPARLGHVIEEAEEIGRDIKLESLQRQVDPMEFRTLQMRLGYSVGSAPGLKLAKDPYVRTYRTKLFDKPVLVVEHSRIEYFFVRPEDLEALYRLTH